jgi:hypothetical protein
MCARRISDLSKGKVYKVVNLALKREEKKVTHVERTFCTIHSLQEGNACIYMGCTRKNHVYCIHRLQRSKQHIYRGFQ